MINISDQIKMYLVFDFDYEVGEFLGALNEPNIAAVEGCAERTVSLAIDRRMMTLIRKAHRVMFAYQLGSYVNRLLNSAMADWEWVPMYADVAEIKGASGE